MATPSLRRSDAAIAPALPGAIDPTFQAGALPGTPTAPAIFTFAIQKDDRILLGGSFSEFNRLKTLGLARLLANGEMDAGYLPKLNLKDPTPTRLRIASLALLPDDRAVFDGVGLTDINGQSVRGAKDSAPARLFPDGTLDSGFVPGARQANGVPLPDEVRILAVFSTGEVLVQAGGLRRLAANGTVDETWSNAELVLRGHFVCAGVQSSGNAVAFGQINASQARDVNQDRLYRLRPDGRLDSEFPLWQPLVASGRFGAGELPVIRRILVLPDDKLLLLGTFSWLRQETNLFERGSVARLNADGSLDHTFQSSHGLTDIYLYPDIPQWNATNSRAAFAAALAPDGRLLIGGHFNGYDGVPHANLVRLHTDGRLDTSFAPAPPDRWITQVGVQSDGKVIISSANVVGAAGSPPYAGGPGLVRLEGGLLLPALPQIVRHPGDQSITLPSPGPTEVQFSVSVVSPVTPTFQWFHNGTALTDHGRVFGARTDTLKLSDVVPAEAGRYECVVANASARVTSDPAFLTINASASPAPDSLKPLLQVTSPNVPNLRTTAGRLTFHGIASDNLALARVLVSRDSGPALSPSKGPFEPVDGLTQWHRTFDLVPGTNRFQFKAVDLAGNSSLVSTRVAVFVSMRGFSLAIHGLGNVTRPTFGNSLEAGRVYTLQATPKPGNLFSNWTVNGVSHADPTLRFLLVSDVEIVANFVPNPFLDLAGNYTGLFFDPAAPGHVNAGSFNFRLTSQGALAGKGFAAGQPFRLGGRFGLDLDAQPVAVLPDGQEVPVRLQLTSGPGSEVVSGTVAFAGGASRLLGYRARSASSPPGGPTAGQYNVLLSRPPPHSGDSRGHGYAVAHVNSSGTLRLNGQLGDGTTWVGAGPISGQGHFPLYVSLSRGQGSLFGWVMLASTDASDAQGTLFWTQPGRFTNQVALVGSRHQPPARGEPWMEFDRALLIRNGGSLPGSITNSVVIAAGQRFVIDDAHADGLGLTLKASTGLITGRFRQPGGEVISMKGVLLQKQRGGGGLFLGADEPGAFVLESHEPFFAP